MPVAAAPQRADQDLAVENLAAGSAHLLVAVGRVDGRPPANDAAKKRATGRTGHAEMTLEWLEGAAVWLRSNRSRDQRHLLPGDNRFD